ncbi:MAG: hypothetical protein VW455_04010 [Nitrospinota bacterium]
MTIEIIREILGWCIVINLGILLFWWLCLMLAHDWVYGFHSKWFKLSLEKFDEIHYQGIAIYKIAIFITNISPYFAFKIVG